MRLPVIIVILLLGLLTGAAAADVIIRVYDVRDLLYTPKDFPAPKLGLDGLDEESGDPFRDEDDLNGPIISAEELVELIKTHIQPDRWEQAGNSVRVHNGQLIVVAEMETHQQVSASLQQWRIDGAPNTYAINARVIPSDLVLLTALGFDGKSKRNSRAIDAKRLSNALAGRTAKAHEFPQLSVLEGQTSHVLRVKQTAYVADARRNEETGVVEQKIEVLNEGVTLEATIRKCGLERILVTWKAQVARSTGSEFAKINGTDVELPELAITSLHGRIVVQYGRTLAIRGLPHPDGETEGDYLWLIDITKVEHKKPEADL